MSGQNCGCWWRVWRLRYSNPKKSLLGLEISPGDVASVWHFCLPSHYVSCIWIWRMLRPLLSTSTPTAVLRLLGCWTHTCPSSEPTANHWLSLPPLWWAAAGMFLLIPTSPGRVVAAQPRSCLLSIFLAPMGEWAWWKGPFWEPWTTSQCHVEVVWFPRSTHISYPFPGASRAAGLLAAPLQHFSLVLQPSLLWLHRGQGTSVQITASKPVREDLETGYGVTWKLRCICGVWLMSSRWLLAQRWSTIYFPIIWPHPWSWPSWRSLLDLDQNWTGSPHPCSTILHSAADGVDHLAGRPVRMFTSARLL